MFNKFLLNEIQSNMYIISSNNKFNERTNIDKEEFGLFLTYTLLSNSIFNWKINMVYRESLFDAQENYSTYHQYASFFHYKTEDIALSSFYSYFLTQKSFLFSSFGLMYSRVNIETSESVDGKFQDSYIDTNTKALGAKLGIGYNYNYSNNLTFTFNIDAWRLNFDTLDVASRVGDTLPKAKLKENSFSTYMGVSWLF